MAKKVKVAKVLSFEELCGKVIPVFTTSPQCATVIELRDNHPQERTYVHTQQATLKFSDTAADTHKVSFTPAGSGYLGTFTLGPVNQVADTVGWTFKLQDGAIDYLQAGQTLVQTYKVTLTDITGRTATTSVTIKIVGTNDAPVITSAVQAATVTEIADGAAGENATTHARTGTVTFNDVDKLDTHTAKVAPLGNGYLGALTIGSVNQNTDSIGWTFRVADSVLDSLGPNDVRVQQYRVTVDDGHGGTASQIVTITIRGANDGVTISDLTPAASGGDVTVDEDDLPTGSDTTKESLTSVGTFKITTPDGLDDLIVGGRAIITNGVFTATSFSSPLGNTLRFTSFNSATGVVTYSYTLNGAEQHTAGAGENALFESFTVVLTDRDGSSANSSLAVRIIDDVPSIRAVGVTGKLIVDETNLASNATASFAGSFASAYGADGAGSLVYALGVSAQGVNSGLIDTATGNAILLFNESGAIVGRVGSSGGAVSFRATVDSAGNVTLDQQRAIAHTANAGPDEAVSIAANLVTLTGRITDRDGDSASASVNIGASLIFKDDAPSISVGNAGAPALVVDESNLAVNATASFAGSFIGSFGADGAGSLVYALGVSAQGVNSGLTDTATGNAIFLFNESGAIVGRVGSSAGDVSFRVTVDASGNVTLDQQRAIVHTDSTNPDESVSIAANLVSLTGRITDRDGDAATATLDIGGSLIFKDDAPAIGVRNASIPLLAVDETALGSDASTNVAANFGTTYGADGAGAITYALVNITPGVDTGLVDTASGDSILLFSEGGAIVGRAGNSAGAISFTVTIDSAGNVTLDQQRAIAHTPDTGPNQSVSLGANFISVSATITDRDGDFARASIDIGSSLVFHDDAPAARNDADAVTAVSSPVATGNVVSGLDGGLGTDSNGTDGVADTLGADGFGSISWAGAVGSTVAGGYGNLTVDAAGNYSYTVNSNHPTVLALNSNQSLTETFTYTIRDADGDPAIATLTITVNGADDPVTISGLDVAGGELVVDEDDLAASRGAGESAGSSPNAAALTQTGTFTITAPDGVAAISVHNTSVPLTGPFPLNITTPLGNTLSITGFNAATGVVSYAYTLLDNEAHPAGLGENSITESFTVEVTDTDGSQATGSIDVRIVDDIVSVDIGGASTVNENGAPVNGTYQFTAGADGLLLGQLMVNVDGTNVQVVDVNALLDGETIVTSAGTLVVGAPTPAGTGTWTFTPSSISATANVNITISMTDGDLDTASDTHIIRVVNVNTPLGISGAASGLVEEEHGLPGGIEDQVSGPPDLDADTAGNFGLTSNVHQGSFGSVVTGGIDGALSFAFAGLSGNPAVQTVANGALTSAGRPVYFATSGGNLIGYTNGDGGSGPYGAGDTKVFELALTDTATGAYTFTLLAPVDHPAGGGENTLAINLNGRVVVSDAGGPVGDTNVPLNASITVIDDVPVAVGDTASVVEGEGKDFNCAFVLDFSGSIDNVELNQMLQAVATAAQQLFDGTSGDVRVHLFPFAGDATSYGPFTTFAALQAQLNAINPLAGGTAPGSIGFTTDFTAAIQQTMAVYTPLAGWSNQVFFLSDGNPNEQTGSTGGSLNDPTTIAWNAFVNGANPINVTTIGIGDGINTARLQDVDVDGSGAPISVGNFDELIDTLLSVVLGGDISGNVLTNDGFGADGAGRIASIAINGVTYSYNGTQITSSAGGAPVAGNLLSNITTEIGGRLTFNFATGAWHFTAPTGIAADRIGTFNYTIVDRDGDSSTASLQITVQNANEAPVNTVPASIGVQEDTPTKLSGISFADADIGTSNLTVTLSIPGASGALTASSASGVTVGGSASALTLTGTLAAINAFLLNPAQGVTFTPLANSTADVTLTVTSNDGGASGLGGAKIDSDTVLLDLTPVNDAPVATITAASYAAIEDTSLALHGTGLSVFDVDAGSASIVAQLSVTAGILNVTAGNSGASVSGSGSSTVTITGSQQQINNLLGGIDTGPGSAGSIHYVANLDTPPANATLSLHVNDTGDTGAGGALTDTKSVLINITPVDDAPVARDDAIITNIAGNPASIVIPDYALLYNDTDAEGQSITLTNVFSASGGTVTDGSGSVTFSDPNPRGGSFSYTATAGSLTDTATVTIDRVNSNTDPLNGDNNANILISGTNGDEINGFGGNDVLIGNSGNDELNGGLGNDLLVGGSGSDRFIFNTTLNSATNVDTILDFDANPADGSQDYIYLDNGAGLFSALPGGTLSSAAFVANTTGEASASSQRIIFDTNTGALYYDADGNGAGAKVQFATLTLSGISGGAAAVDHTDFYVI
ncbi:MAG TPA: DUF5801 repeats-in-toxin domain-containing protein [Hyphomicrobium zavarzinii]|nr:DUF5801 repeats-in-toxin domain-containing protein [Hyphomicrobium zavarzinii]